MSPVLEPKPTGLDPTLAFPVKFCIFNILWTFLAGEITGNASQVDRVWTFLPVLYSAYWGWYLPFYGNEDNAWIKEQGISPRAALMVLLQVVWSFRLSYNTARRGLFSLKDEDYRWAIVRAKIPSWLFSLFNFVFVALTQNVLLFLMALPVHHALYQQDLPLATPDYVLALLTAVELAIQFTADNQQHAFQSFKHSRPAANNGEQKPQGCFGSNAWPGARLEWTEEDAQRGFITKGLWAWSRHPNFLCEQTFWYLQSLFPILASTSLSKATDPDAITALWPLVPPLALSVLFVGSTTLTESISRGKYPEYEAYQSRVGMFSPIDTLWKGLLLRARGQLEKVNEIVYGTRSKAE
ncbi:integral membrane protein [Rhizoctonia solani AG-3 Rhs1AP]|uniref:Integral membrane protein n=1 Tax=Rhizoctonia solani AG-3 Rhs1AP TaxID=1086054 RepID=X8J5J1_9AGAM|nr:integral membrane protein [Rhizoctonia solani AG-3 Rhs1AP]